MSRRDLSRVPPATASIATAAIYLRSDSAQASADPRARLSFARPGGNVTAFPIGGGNAVVTAGAP